jgi:hypothetical protein
MNDNDKKDCALLLGTVSALVPRNPGKQRNPQSV